MSDILSQLWTPELQMAVTVCIIMLVAVYVLSIIWVVRDAYQRGTVWYIWAIVALVPILGVIAYCLLRPPLLQIDRDEQELEVALKQRQLMAVWRMRQLRLPGRGRLCAVPELPPAFEEPMPEVRSCARSFVDRLSVLRNAASRHRRSSQRSNYRRAEAGCAPGECRGSWPGTAPVSADLVCNPALRKAACARLFLLSRPKSRR